MTFDPTLPVAADHGRPVRILASDMKAGYPIVAAHTGSDGREHIQYHQADGSCYHYVLPVYDLYNVPERVIKDRHACLRPSGFISFDSNKPNNVRFTFEENKLVDVELIGND